MSDNRKENPDRGDDTQIAHVRRNLTHVARHDVSQTSKRKRSTYQNLEKLLLYASQQKHFALSQRMERTKHSRRQGLSKDDSLGTKDGNTQVFPSFVFLFQINFLSVRNHYNASPFRSVEGYNSIVKKHVSNLYMWMTITIVLSCRNHSILWVNFCQK